MNIYDIFDTAVSTAFGTVKSTTPEGVGELAFRAIEKMRKHLNDEEIQEIIGIGVVSTFFVIELGMEDEKSKEGDK